MKFTQILCKHHLGRMIKFNWFAHGKQLIGETPAEKSLAQRGIRALDVSEVIPRSNPPKLVPPEVWQEFITRKQESAVHPDTKEKPCRKHGNTDLLVEGTNQAQVLLKTLIIQNSLPDKVEALVEDTSEDLNTQLKRIVATSNIFNAHQERLPKRKDPARPAWNFPREYGLTDVRKSRNLVHSMVQLCEQICGPNLVEQRQLVHSGIVQVPLERNDDLLLLNQTMDLLIVSKKGLTPCEESVDTSKLQIPDIYPLLPAVSLHEEYIYNPANLYPVSEHSAWNNPHTVFVYHDMVNVKNLTELPVTETQLQARAMMKSFVAAAGRAQQRFGNDIKDLPEPITVQCIYSDSQAFHFSVFQLNTLDLDSTEGQFNFWWSMPRMNLFEKAMYEKGRPVLEGYNPEVFKRVLAFYRNI